MEASMANIQGKVFVVTGATSGLGQATAIDFGRKGARVIVVGRDEVRAKETANAIGANAEIVIGDVSTRAGVEAVANAILAKTDHVDVLVNNAGGQFKEKKLTIDGVEMTFALNVLGAYLLEKKLHGALAKSKGRVVNLATGFLNSFPLDPADVAVRAKKWSSLNQYGQAKQAAVMMTVEQTKRNGDVTYVSMHPGIIMGTRFNGGQSKIQQAIGGPIMRAIGMACTLEEAVAKFHAAAFGDIPNGSYLINGKPAALPKQVNDELVRAKVMKLLEDLADGKSATKAA
jgi:NAD(P)-dependent dehydrogenase (short-subunit alcohol dehydrogenase family)